MVEEIKNSPVTAEGGGATTRDAAREEAASALRSARTIVEEMAATDPENRVLGEVRVHALVSIATEWRYLAEGL